VGATFWFEIELETATKDDVRPQRCAELSARGGVRILLVEDLPINQELACIVLRRAGHQVDIANDGIEAVEAATNNSYDLILMDIQMPRMDGVTATKIIRQLDGPAGRTPIIAMTANSLPEQVRAYRQAGMDDHVAKPFRQDDLHEAIRRAITPATTGENLATAEDNVSSTSQSFPDNGCADPAIFDASVLAGVQRLVPIERVYEYLEDLDQAHMALIGGECNQASMQIQAHKIVSNAGMLGLTRMSECAKEMETASRTGVGVAAALKQCRKAAGDIRDYALPAASAHSG
jgi:CheY-like chemotaxis protein/HPt (histidine-containing phosphotransfer) domain-containing protein